MKLFLPPHQETVTAGEGAVIRGAAESILAAHGEVGAMFEDRPPETIVVERNYATRVDLLAAAGIAHAVTEQ